MIEKQNIRHLSRQQLEVIIKDASQPTFRAKQLYEWIWKKSAISFDEMTNLPVELRNLLAKKFIFEPVVIISKQESTDGSVKYLFGLSDKFSVEGVLIPSIERVTICISSQVGCALNCTFCATAKIGFKRNLDFVEIYDQVALLNKESQVLFGRKITNIVLMGMGEPLLNYHNLIKAINIISSPDALGFSPQRITVSTAGIADKIRKLGDDKVKFNLALSLNMPGNDKRNILMPVNKKYPLEKLKEALKYYFDKTKNIITLEYILLHGVNDRDEDINMLKLFTSGLPVKINLIEYNHVPGLNYVSPSFQMLKEFREKLEAKHFIVNIRRSRGKDIAAACGQLAGKI